MINKSKIKTTVASILLVSLTVYAGGKVAQEALDAVKWILKPSESYSEKQNYSKSIPYMFLGYGKDGKPAQGVAMRSFKTYKKVTALIALKRDGKKIVVDVVDVPDIGVIKDIKKQEKVLEALKGISGTVVQDASGNRHKIDAVTGATRYQKRIYLYLDKMSDALITEMQANPKWERKPVK